MGLGFVLACRVGDILEGPPYNKFVCVCQMNMHEKYFTEILGSGSHAGVPMAPSAVTPLL